MNNLDSYSYIKSLDKGNILESIQGFPSQIKQAWNDTLNINLPSNYTGFENVVISGMGGSALGGRIIDFLTVERSVIPVEIYTEYFLPAYVNRNSLVIISSYSGNTEETLKDFNQAVKSGTKIFGITSGGKLEKHLMDSKYPFFKIKPISNPSNQPRMALGYSIGSLLAILSKCSVIKLTSDEMNNAIKFIDEKIKDFDIDTQENKNEAKLISSKLKDHIPVLITSEHLIGSAYSFKNQLNENSKNMAFIFDLPEANHHLLEGLRNPSIVKNYYKFLFIESDNFYPRVGIRYKITQNVVDKNEIEWISYKTTGKTKLEEVLEITLLGQYVSFYLSILYGIDPTPIPWVDYFKKQLG